MKIKHLFIGILLATTALNVAAQPVSKQYFVPKAGTLISLMTEDEANSITHLTLTGKINAEDFKHLRDEFQNLEVLDISKKTPLSKVVTILPSARLKRKHRPTCCRKD